RRGIPRGACSASANRRAVEESTGRCGKRKEGGRRRGLLACSRLPVPTIWPCSKLSSSGRVAVAAPALPIPGARATADFGDPQIEDAGFAKAGEVTDHVNRQRYGKREEAARDQEGLGGDCRVDDEIAVGHARKHLR